ncbi:hypothetical protein C8R47DRAFT_569313 [Mycena vitilis]|nr:hypothetical protein C8R47DRAFT_569313 [Mycena vitilis]
MMLINYVRFSSYSLSFYSSQRCDKPGARQHSNRSSLKGWPRYALKPIIVMSHPSVPRVFVLRSKRTNLACSNCRRRKIKCVPRNDSTQEPCERCSKRGLTCEFVAIGGADAHDTSDHASTSYAPPASANSPSPPSQFPPTSYMHDNRDRVGSPSHYPQSHTLRMNSPNSGAPYGNPSPAPLGQTWTPQYPVHAQQVGQYAQHPSYGAQSLGASPYNDAYNPAAFSSGSPAGQFGYIPNDTADGSSSYRPPPTGYYPCTCPPGTPCYCGGLRR